MRNVCLAIISLACTACMAQEPHVVLNGEKFTVELAETVNQQALGLMFREELADDHGMLFIFPAEGMRSFWMRNTRIPLDIFYFDGELHVFMDVEDFTQYSLSPDDLEGQTGYISEDMDPVLVMIIEDQPVGIQLPATVTLEVTETSPSIKGATVTKRTKPAVLSTGLEVQVPEYLSPGEMIKVNTTNAKFMARA